MLMKCIAVMEVGGPCFIFDMDVNTQWLEDDYLELHFNMRQFNLTNNTHTMLLYEYYIYMHNVIQYQWNSLLMVALSDVWYHI